MINFGDDNVRGAFAASFGLLGFGVGRALFNHSGNPAERVILPAMFSWIGIGVGMITAIGLEHPPVGVAVYGPLFLSLGYDMVTGQDR